MGIGKKYAVEILVIDGDSTIAANSSGYSLKEHANQPDCVGKPPTKTALKRNKGMVPLNVQLVKKFLCDQNHFVCALCKPIFGISKTKNNGKHPTKYFANKYKFSMLVTLKQSLDGVTIFILQNCVLLL